MAPMRIINGVILLGTLACNREAAEISAPPAPTTSTSLSPSPSTSTLASDWGQPAIQGNLRSYVVDWSCEPKRYGAKAETSIAFQEEYCEWTVIKQSETEKTCAFTTSFEYQRSFYLNSRRVTPFNTTGAARALIDACAADATRRLTEGLSPGSLCKDVEGSCAPGRNSDPEICTRIRDVVEQRFEEKIDFCIESLSPDESIFIIKPMIQFGLLTDIPSNCRYSQNDQTEIHCTIPKDDDCFSIAGQLRPGLRVQTRAQNAHMLLPEAERCYVPTGVL